MATISEQKLDFWIQNNLNVLMRGKHGAGKTSMIVEAFERNGIRWKYFSAPTMDPWVDFIGAPKEKVGEDGIPYLELIRPKEFARDEIEGLFFDELNRAKPKVLNAIMELIQFKSINGHKFNNLKFIWASINPEKDEDDDTSLDYMVQTLDPAQKDRFHVIIDTDYKPNKKYFVNRFGDEIASAAIEWWNRLGAKMQDEVSPRRLQYALDMNAIGGDLTDVLPKGCNVSELVIQLKTGSFRSNLDALMKNDDAEEIRQSFASSNFYNGAIKLIKEKGKYLNYFHSYLEPEQLSKLIMSDENFRKNILSDKDKLVTHASVLGNIVDTGVGKRNVIKEIKEALLFNKVRDNNNVSEILTTYHDEYKHGMFNNHNDKTQITALIVHSLSELPDDMNVLTKIFAINCSIGAVSYGNFWSDTKKIIKYITNKINKIQPELSNEEFYEQYVKKDKVFKKVVTSSNIGRLEKRFKQMGFLQ